MTGISIKLLLVMIGLGFSCGLPFALSHSVLKVLLTQNGLSVAAVGAATLVSLPYSIKLVLAPIVDFKAIPYLTQNLGRRRAWICAAQVGLLISIAAASAFCTHSNLRSIIAITAIIATFSCLQDLAVDSYRIEQLRTNEQGPGVSAYTWGYRIGVLFSGGGAFVLAEKYGWQVAYGFCSLLCVIGLISNFLAIEPVQAIRVAHERSWTDLKKALLHLFGTDSWQAKLLIAVCFKLSDSLIGSMTYRFLLDKGFSMIELAQYVKWYGLFFTLLGVTVGGALVRSIGQQRALLIGGILQICSNLGFVVQNYVGHSATTLICVIAIENVCSAIGDVAIVCYLTSLCQPGFATSQYAALTSISGLARTVIASTSGLVVDAVGWNAFFYLTLPLTMPALFALYRLRRRRLV